ncbi:U3 small nucleolar RNA-associated protein 5 like [Verticillium longisporum]|uniref:U3 small nucleolar RNA-associated protein 5 like n=1 Tax=Verticillium longisporum TaxID=100787 RepID=A0A8I2Z768_VERLO|nr:U3 small nucleolar RNA-associated protein 5 like [Verticillium longisporum]
MSAKRKASARFAPPAIKSAIKVATKARIDESRTAVSSTDNIQASARNQTQETIDISSDSNSDDDDDEDASDDGAGSDNLMNGVEATGAAPSIAAANSTTQATTTDTADADSEDAEDATSPSFGELLRGTIDVPAILSQQALSSAPKASASKALTATTTTATATTPLDPPSLSSLSTVLTQALRTEDTELLESCLQITDTPSIHATIERLDSALAGVLLTRLAARFHRRPGRAGSLMAWVKWTLVAHGGALALQPKVLDRLVALQKVLNERARGLPSLLALKGKLDMLDAQMQLRQSRQRGRGRGVAGAEDDDDDEEDDEDEEGAIYVEGEEADVDVAISEANGALLALEEGDDNVPGTNGFAADSDVDDDDSDVEEPESDDDGEEVLDEDDVDHLDVEDSMDEDEDSDAEAAPPSKLRKTARSFGKRR